MRILIISSHQDAHADAIHWALKEWGCSVDFLDIADYPGSLEAGIWSTATGASIELSDGRKLSRGLYDTVWVRRKDKPKPHPDTHSEDLVIVKRESERFIENLLPWLGHDRTLWVNHPDSDYRANLKLHQLVVAREIGFMTPPTYMGNSPEAVRSLFKRYNDGIIYKAFRSGGWANPDGTNTALRTSRLNASHVTNDFAIAANPGIYQALVPKKFEVRVTVFGTNVFAAKIDSQADRETVDWRFDFRPGREPFSPFMLPNEVAERCLDMCRQLALTFAAFDFVVDDKNHYVFLELNPAGQFLFIEESVKSIKLLDTFARFLAQSASELSSAPPLTLDGYFSSGAFEALRTRELHSSISKE